MVEREFGIEDARKTLGQLIQWAHDGDTIYVTRHRHRVALITPVVDDADRARQPWEESVSQALEDTWREARRSVGAELRAQGDM